MGHMHVSGKGLSHKALTYRHSVPTWLKLTSDNITVPWKLNITLINYAAY
ncbi:hypothetical protein EI555_009653, partial [Monodon monoceros]